MIFAIPHKLIEKEWSDWVDEKLKELRALLRQKEGNLTEYGRERIRTLKKELRNQGKID